MTFAAPAEIRSVASVGLGTVGASWAALMLAKGIDVRGFDTDDDAETRARSLIESAWPSLRQLGATALASPPFEKLTMFGTVEEAVETADLVQDNTPEVLDTKQEVFERIDSAAAPSVIVLSSTGGIMPSKLQGFCRNPGRLVVFHPFNPAHIVPLVEVVPGKQTAPEVVEWAMDFARYLGKKPICLRAEIVGHMTNRLQFALVREAVRCIVENVASPKDVDAAVRYGLAPRWMLMGGLQTLHLAGGYGGMKAILDHAGPAIENWWNPGGEIRLTEEVKCALVKASADLSEDSEISEWMAWRDAELVPLLGAQAIADEKQPHKKGNRGV